MLLDAHRYSLDQGELSLSCFGGVFFCVCVWIDRGFALNQQGRVKSLSPPPKNLMGSLRHRRDLARHYVRYFLREAFHCEFFTTSFSPSLVSLIGFGFNLTFVNGAKLSTIPTMCSSMQGPFLRSRCNSFSPSPCQPCRKVE